MTQVKLSSKFQIVIPEDVREQLGLEPGQLMQVWALDGHVVAVPVRPLSERSACSRASTETARARRIGFHSKDHAGATKCATSSQPCSNATKAG